MRKVALIAKVLAVLAGLTVIYYFQLKPALDNQRETNQVIQAEKVEHDEIWARIERKRHGHAQ